MNRLREKRHENLRQEIKDRFGQPERTEHCYSAAYVQRDVNNLFFQSRNQPSQNHSWAAHAMRLIIVILLACSDITLANPRIASSYRSAYLASERLVIEVKPTEARFTGDFHFRFTEPTRPFQPYQSRRAMRR